MHYADINAALIKKGYTPTVLAGDLECSPGAITQVIRGKTASRRIATHIAKLLGRPVSQVWPDRYPAVELAEIRSSRKRAA